MSKSGAGDLRSAPLLRATKNLPLLFLHREYHLVEVLLRYCLAARGPQPSAAWEGGPIQSSAHLRENVHCTFSGFNFLPTFLDLVLEVGVDRIMFSTDHPYQPMAEGRAFRDRLPVSDADRERIAHGNAEQLFGKGVAGPVQRTILHKTPEA